MKIRNALPIFLMLSALSAYHPAKANAEEVNVNLFPKQPIRSELMAGPEAFQTGASLENPKKDIFYTPMKDLFSKVFVSKTLPLISLGFENPSLASRIPDTTSNFRSPFYKPSNETLLAYLIAGGQASFQSPDIMEYKIKAEMVLDSPAMDDRVSNGNHLYLDAGLMGGSSGKLENIVNKNAADMLNSAIKNPSWFLNFYMVPHNVKGNQFLAARIGVRSVPESKYFVLDTSLSAEFPISKNLRPYFLTYFSLPMDHSKASELITKIGIEMSNIMPYLQVGIKNNISISAGINID